MGLYQAVLGAHFDGLHPALQAFHSGQPLRLSGTVTVIHGPSLIAKMFLRLMRLPKPCVKAPCAVVIKTHGSQEQWLRTMNGTAMSSQQFVLNQAIAEYLFPYTITLDTVVRGGQLWQRSSGGRVFGLRLPSVLCMTVHAHEQGLKAIHNPAGFSFNVRMYLPLLGGFLKYKGVLYFE